MACRNQKAFGGAMGKAESNNRRTVSGDEIRSAGDKLGTFRFGNFLKARLNESSGDFINCMECSWGSLDEADQILCHSNLLLIHMNLLLGEKEQKLYLLIL
jgi:hypothetical protein